MTFVAGWLQSSLGQTLQLQRGHDLPAQHRRTGDIPILGSFGVTGHHDTALYDSPGVSIGRSGASIGTATFVQQAYWPLNTVLFVRDFKGNDPRWVFYLLDHMDFTGFNSGSAQPSLNRNYLTRIPVQVPPLGEQRGIAELLGALDDKVESNQRSISAIHELAAAWCQSFLGSPTQRWTEAWPNCRLEEVLSTLEVGRRPVGGIKHEPKGIPSIGAESIVRAGSFDFSKTKRVSEAFFAGMRRGHLEHLDVLLYKDGGTPGNFIPHVSAVGHGFPFAVASINEHVYRLRIKPPYTQSFLYFCLSSPRLLAEMRRRGTGAAIPGLNSSAVRDLPVPQPPADILWNLQEALDSLLDLILRSAKESRACAQMRDALLPELLSGRIRVPEAGEAVESALA